MFTVTTHLRKVDQGEFARISGTASIELSMDVKITQNTRNKQLMGRNFDLASGWGFGNSWPSGDTRIVSKQAESAQ